MIKRVYSELVYQVRFGMPVWAIMLLCAWFPDTGPTARIRGLMLSWFLPGRPKKLSVGRDVTLLAANRIWIGRNVYFAKGCWLNGVGGIVVDDEVVLAPYVVMSSNNHGFKDGSVQRGGAHPAPIRVGFGTWVAAHSVIVAGVAVERGCVIAANSVVTKNTDADSVYAGVPAKFVKFRHDNPSTIKSKHDVTSMRQ